MCMLLSACLCRSQLNYGCLMQAVPDTWAGVPQEYLAMLRRGLHVDGGLSLEEMEAVVLRCLRSGRKL